MKLLRVISLVAVLTLIAAACGGSDETSTDSSADSTTSTADSTTTEPTDSAPETSEPEESAEEDVPLTDSFRGVTADTITIGFTAVDFDKLRSGFGVDLPHTGFREIADALIADLNARGGINGRNVALEFRTFLPVGAAEADAACISLTEDTPVFAVLNGFGGPGTEAVNECIVMAHETILVGGSPTPEQIAREGATWITPQLALIRRVQALPGLLEDSGLLDDFGSSVALIASGEADRPPTDELEAVLTAAGVNVTSSATITTTGDEVATSAAVATIVERARVDGAGAIFILGEDRYALESLLTYDVPIFLVNGDRSTDWRSDPLNGLDSSDLVYTSRSPSDVEEPRLAECKSIAEAALGVEIIEAGKLDAGVPSYWSALIAVCTELTIFEALATEAGPDLTNESFAAAMNTIDEIPLPGATFASLGPDKRDARDALLLAQWNHDELQWDELTEPIDITKS